MDNTTIRTYGVANKEMVGTWSIEIKLSVTLNGTTLDNIYKLQLQIYEPEVKDQTLKEDS